MLRKAEDIIGLDLNATDDEVGKVRDLYFNDQDWVVQYFVADTGSWLSHRKVLLSPEAVGEPDWETRSLPVSLSCEQIEAGPPLASDEPVSRQHRQRLASYYNWGVYWAGGPGALGSAMAGMVPQTPAQQADRSESDQADPHLRSCREILGYAIQAEDGEIGHIEDLLLQTEDWAIYYLIVDTRNWLPGRHVLLSPAWIAELSWPDRHVRVDVSRAQVREAPEYDPAGLPTREYEHRLHEHYGKPKYWEQQDTS